jgi:hypothetical protein
VWLFSSRTQSRPGASLTYCLDLLESSLFLSSC